MTDGNNTGFVIFFKKACFGTTRFAMPGLCYCKAYSTEGIDIVGYKHINISISYIYF